MEPPSSHPCCSLVPSTLTGSSNRPRPTAQLGSCPPCAWTRFPCSPLPGATFRNVTSAVGDFHVPVHPNHHRVLPVRLFRLGTPHATFQMRALKFSSLSNSIAIVGAVPLRSLLPFRPQRVVRDVIFIIRLPCPLPCCKILPHQKSIVPFGASTLPPFSELSVNPFTASSRIADPSARNRIVASPAVARPPL